MGQLIAALLACCIATAQADDKHDHGPTGRGPTGHGAAGHGDMALGAPGDPAQAKRTIEIIAIDNAFDVKSLRVSAGETVKLVIRNKGQLLHEFTIGDAAMHQTHQAEMEKLLQQGVITTIGIDAAKLAAVGHGHGNSVLIEPGKTGTLVWRFAKDGVFEFACNIPGHYQDGMRGQIQIR